MQWSMCARVMDSIRWMGGIEILMTSEEWHRRPSLHVFILHIARSVVKKRNAMYHLLSELVLKNIAGRSLAIRLYMHSRYVWLAAIRRRWDSGCVALASSTGRTESHEEQIYICLRSEEKEKRICHERELVHGKPCKGKFAIMLNLNSVGYVMVSVLPPIGHQPTTASSLAWWDREHKCNAKYYGRSMDRQPISNAHDRSCFQPNIRSGGSISIPIS